MNNNDNVIYNILLTNNVRFYATLAVAQDIVDRYPAMTGESPRIRLKAPMQVVKSADAWFADDSDDGAPRQG